jgi:hypothetical protein
VRRGAAPEAVLGSIAGYYARVTTAARPMNRLIAAVMVATLTAIVAEIVRDTQPGWIGPVSLALARSIFRGHVFCAFAMAGVLAVQLALG